MGGFSGVLRSQPADRDLLRALSRAAARRARVFHLRWRCSISSDGAVKFSVDGNWTRMRLFVERLRKDLPNLAEGVETGKTPMRRRRLAHGFVDIIIKWLYGFYDRYGLDHVPRLVERSAMSTFAVHDLWPGKRHEDLHNRLTVTIEVLTNWALDQASAEVVIEEIHTAAELLMARRAGKRRADLSFAEMVAREVRSGGLNQPLVLAYLEDESALLTMPELLVAMKDVRRASKHRGEDGAKEWLEKHFWPAVETLEYLAECLREKPRPAPSAETTETLERALKTLRIALQP